MYFGVMTNLSEVSIFIRPFLDSSGPVFVTPICNDRFGFWAHRVGQPPTWMSQEVSKWLVSGL